MFVGCLKIFSKGILRYFKVVPMVFSKILRSFLAVMSISRRDNSGIGRLSKKLNQGRIVYIFSGKGVVEDFCLGAFLKGQAKVKIIIPYPNV